MFHLSHRIDVIEDHTNHFDSQLGVIIEAHDEMVDAYEEQGL